MYPFAACVDYFRSDEAGWVAAWNNAYQYTYVCAFDFERMSVGAVSNYVVLITKAATPTTVEFSLRSAPDHRAAAGLHNGSGTTNTIIRSRFNDGPQVLVVDRVDATTIDYYLGQNPPVRATHAVAHSIATDSVRFPDGGPSIPRVFSAGVVNRRLTYSELMYVLGHPFDWTTIFTKGVDGELSGVFKAQAGCSTVVTSHPSGLTNSSADSWSPCGYGYSDDFTEVVPS